MAICDDDHYQCWYVLAHTLKRSEDELHHDHIADVWIFGCYVYNALSDVEFMLICLTFASVRVLQGMKRGLQRAYGGLGLLRRHTAADEEGAAACLKQGRGRLQRMFCVL